MTYDLDRLKAPSIHRDHHPEMFDRMIEKEATFRASAALARAMGSEARALELEEQARKLRHALRHGRLMKRHLAKHASH